MHFMHVKVHEIQSQAQSASEERKVMRKQQAESNSQESASHKKAKTKEDDTVHEDGIRAEFEEFCKNITEHLSVKQMREILEENSQYSKGEDDAVVPRW